MKPMSDEEQVAGCRATVMTDEDPRWMSYSFRVPSTPEMLAQMKGSKVTTLKGKPAATLFFEFASAVVAEVLKRIPEKDALDWVRMIRDPNHGKVPKQ